MLTNQRKELIIKELEKRAVFATLRAGLSATTSGVGRVAAGVGGAMKGGLRGLKKGWSLPRTGGSMAHRIMNAPGETGTAMLVKGFRGMKQGWKSGFNRIPRRGNVTAPGLPGGVPYRR